MKSCTFELIVNILTYAIKNRNTTFSQKDFKNVVYTKEFNNFDINDKIADGFEYLLKRGLLQLENKHVTFYEKYKLPNTIKINTENYTNVFKELSKRIILMYEGKEMINDTYEVKDDYAEIIEAIKFSNAGFLDKKDKEQLKNTLSKILVSLNMESKASYSLLSVIQLLELKASMKIKIKTDSSEFLANNVKFNNLQFNDETMILFFNKCSFEIKNLEDILSIESIDEEPLQNDLEKTIQMLENYPNGEKTSLIDFLIKNRDSNNS